MSADEMTKNEVLDYMSSMLRELGQMAKSNGQNMLGYLIDMAQLEAAEQLAATKRPSQVRRQQRHSAS